MAAEKTLMYGHQDNTDSLACPLGVRGFHCTAIYNSINSFTDFKASIVARQD